MNYKIALIHGDGIGPEIVNEAKKILDKVMTMSADAALEAALASVGFASHAGTYQPKEPETLENLKKSK